jgi:hypothetical protein
MPNYIVCNEKARLESPGPVSMTFTRLGGQIRPMKVIWLYCVPNRALCQCTALRLQQCRASDLEASCLVSKGTALNAAMIRSKGTARWGKDNKRLPRRTGRQTAAPSTEVLYIPIRAVLALCPGSCGLFSYRDSWVKARF